MFVFAALVSAICLSLLRGDGILSATVLIASGLIYAGACCTPLLPFLICAGRLSVKLKVSGAAIFPMTFLMRVGHLSVKLKVYDQVLQSVVPKLRKCSPAIIIVATACAKTL